MSRLVVALLTLLVASCSELVSPSNPFDPDTPAGQQAPASLRGQILISDDADDASRELALSAIRVGLLDENGRRLQENGVDIARALVGIGPDGDGLSIADFVFDALVPGTYSVIVGRAPALYQAPTLPTVRLGPGSTTDVGALLYSFVGDGEAGPGRIDGEVRAVGGASGQHRVSLFLRRGQTTELARSVVTDGAFDFASLVLGSYAIVVESEGFTPVYRLGVQVAAQEEGEARLQHQFAGDSALVVHPVTAALQPAIGDPTVILDEGLVFVRGDSAPLLVLPFVSRADLELGITGMRLATDPSFLDAAGQAVPFVPHQATTSVALPSVDGAVQIFAQFEARSVDNAFAFVSPTASISLTRDTTAPTIVEVRAIGITLDGQGRALSPSRTVNIAIDATDATSAVDAVGVAFDVEPVVLADITTTPGLQRIAQSLTAEIDGPREIVIVVEDRAGNRSPPTRLPVVIDTAAPAVALDVLGTSDGFLRSRVATLDVTTTPAADDVVVAVGLEGAVNEFDLGPAGRRDLVLPANLSHGATVTFEVVAIDVVGNRSSATRSVVLDLRGTVSGAIGSDAVPGVINSVAGASVSLVDARGTVVGGPRLVDGTGDFTFPGVIEGRGYSVRATFAGHAEATVRNIAVDVDAAVDLGDMVLALSRAEVRGRALRADVVGDDTAHAGIAVSARLVSTTRSFSETVISDASGIWTLRGVPRALSGESLALTAQAADYGAATADIQLGDALVTAPDLLLPRGRGDFEVCRTADPTCTPAQFFSADSFDVRLRDATDVVAIHVGLNGAASERLPGGGGRTTVSLIGLADGEIVVTVQAEAADGSRSEVLSSTVIRDTTPPATPSITRRASPQARDPRFTNAAFVDVVVDADPGLGAVAPLGTARVVLADDTPAVPATGFVSCTHETSCRVALPNVERLQRVFAFSCDAAGNCAAPVETFIVRDTTPPTRANGAAFRVAATGSVVDGTTTILASPFYSGVIDTGAASTLDGTTVVDEVGGAVAEVFAFRFSLSQANLQNVAIQGFVDPPRADETRDGADIVVPPLPAGDRSHTVFAQFVDAAGNVSQEQIAVGLLVDTLGPVAVVTLNGGQPTNLLTVPVTLAVPAGAEAPVRVELTVDAAVAQVFSVPFSGTETLALPPVDGLRLVVVNAFDRVGNATRSDQTILLDRAGPRIDAARCTTSTCTDNGFGELLTRAADARIDLAVTAVDALSTVATVEVTTTPALPGGAQLASLVGGALPRVLVPANTASTLSLVPIDAVGNRGAAFVRAVRHDVTPPVIGSVAIADGAVRTNALQVPVQISVPANDAVELRLAPTTSFSGPFSVFRANEFFTFAGADGERQVCVEVRDTAGNAASACDTILLDRTPPTGTVTVVAAVVASAATAATLSYPADTVQVATSTAGLTCDPATTPYGIATGSPQTVNVQLDGADGTRTIFACFRDEAGNVAQATTTVTVDRAAPTVSLTLDSGAAFTTTTTPAARVVASSDAVGLAVAVDSPLDCASASYGAFSATPPVTLSSVQGLQTVRACVRDVAGNVSTDPAVATIILDNVRPTTSVLINGGVVFASSATVAITLTASSDTVAMALANAASLDCATATYTTFQPTVGHQLTGGDGVRTVSVCVKDAAGQVSAASASDTIVVDTTAPTGVLTVAGGAETTSIATVSAVLSGQSADVVLVAVTASPIACDTAPFEPLGGVTSFEVTLPLPNTVNVVTACLRDGAGNTSAITDTIFFENAAGDALVIAINGGAATTRSRDVTIGMFRPSTEFDQMKVSEVPTLDCADLSNYEAFNGSKAIALSSGSAPAEGQRTVSACVRSSTSGLTRAAADSIFLDTFAPEGSVSINGGAVTSSATVTAALGNAFAAAGEVITVALSEASTVGTGGLCTGSFEAFSAARTFTFTGGDGTATLFVCLRDVAGNTREVQDSIILDRAPPSPVAINVPALTNSTTITVGLLVPADAVQVALGESALDCLTTQGYIAVPVGPSPSLPLTLSAADGTRSIAACFRDAAGNTSQATGTTTLDRTTPSGTVIIDGGASFSTDLTISVAIQNATDAVRMARVESAAPVNCATQPNYVAFVSPLDLPLAAGEGLRTVQVCLEDAAGNRALALADSIVVDTTPPNGSVVINDGAPATNTRTVTLAIGTLGNTDVAAFAAAETSITCNAANLVYAPFAPTVPFVLSSTEGTRTIQVCLKDQAGNVSSIAASDTIILDTAAPTGGAVAINDGDGFLNGEATVGLTVSWASAGDVSAIKVGEGAVDCQSGTGYSAVGQAATSAAVSDFAVSPGEGTKLVLACLRDAAGNVATAQDTTVRDTTPPVVSAVACPDCVSDGGALFSRTANVGLAVTADETGSGLASARVAVDAGAEVALPLVNGAVTVSALAEGPRTLRVKLVDRAGNVSAVSRDIVVTVDVTAPLLGQLLLNGSNSPGNATATRAVAVGLVGASADVSQMAVVEGNGAVSLIATCATATYAPFVPEFTRTLPAVDGTKAVSVCLKDRAGNVTSTPTTTTITLDTVPVSLPATPVVVLDGDGFLQAETTTSVRLSWTTNGDAREAKVQEGIVDCATSSGYVALPVNANTVDLAGIAVSVADGPKTFGVCFKDIAGNIVVAQGSTVRDASAPVVTAVSCPACTLDNGTLFARSTSVTLLASAIEAGSGVASARVSRNGGALTAFPVTAAQFTVTSLVQGPNTLLVKLADLAGNVSGDAVDVDLALTVDTTLPNLAAGSLRLNGLSAGGATNNSLVTASIVGAPTDAAGLFLVEAASAPSCAAVSYGPFALATTLQLSGGDGSKTVFACLRDRAGNTSASAVSAAIVLDTLVPSLPAAAVTILDGGDEFLTSVAGGVQVRLAWNTIGDVVAVKIGENAVDCSSEPYERPAGIATTNTLTLSGVALSAVDGTKVIAACFKDAAGNVASSQDSTTLDQVGPNGAISINGGAAFATDPSEDITVVVRMADDSARFAVVETTNGACLTPTLDCAAATYETFTGVSVDGQLQATKVLNLSGVAAAVEGAKCVEACFEDEAGNRTATASLSGITFDKTAPIVAADNVTLTGTPAGPTTRTTQITVTVAGAPADTTTYRVSEDSSFAGNTQAFVPFTSSPQPFLLSAGDGTRTVFVQLRDAAGNVGAATQKTITLDATAPEATSVTINGGDTFASSTSVTLSLTATGATEMQIAVDGVPDTEPFVAFATSVGATLPTPDGSKLVAVRFRDAAGNSTIATDGIVLDRAPPTGGAVVINDGAAVTNNTTVTLAITPPTDAATMSITGGPFVAVSAVALSAIPAGDCAPGSLCKSISVVFRDAAGNSGTAVTDTIGLDTVPPSSVSVSLVSSVAGDTSGFTTSGTVNASFAFATGAGNATSVKHGEGAVDCATLAGYVALGSTSPFTVSGIALSLSDGQKNYVACFRDAAGNVSSAATSIVADRTRPFGAIAINGGAATTTSTAVTIAVTPAADDVTRVAFVNAAIAPTCSGIAGGAFVDISPTMPHTLAAGDGSKTVFACFRDVAGNSSTLPISATITLDATAPSVAFSLVGNSGAVTGQTNTRTITVVIGSLSADTRELAFGETTLACADAPYEAIPQPVAVPLSRTFFLADGVDGTRTVAICARDAAGNVSGAIGTTRTITLDTTAPQVTVSLNGGAATVTNTTTTATLTPTPAGDLLRRFVSTDPTVDCAQVPDTAYLGATVSVLPASVGVTLTSGDGEKFVAICFKDAAGNVARFGDGILLDTTRPVAGFVVDGGAIFSLDTTVTADFSLVSTDVTQMAVSRTPIADCGSATFSTFANISNVTGLTEGTNVIFACLRDGAGNISDASPAISGLQPFTDGITVDTQNPTLSTFVVAPTTGTSPEAGFVPSIDVTIRASSAAMSNDIVAFAIGNTSLDCSTASYTALPQPLPSLVTTNHTLAAGADGTRTVVVCVKDGAGRTGSRSVDVTLDTTPPQIANFLLNGGSAVTRSALASVTMEASPTTDPLRFALSTSISTDCNQVSFAGGFSPLPSTTAATLASGDGNRAIRGCFQDRAGNVAAAVDEIVVDTTPPLPVSAPCTSCNVLREIAFTGDTTITVEPLVLDADVVAARTVVSNTPNQTDRACTSNAQCRTSEECLSFPADLNGTTFALRCVEAHVDPNNIVVGLNQAGQPIAGMPIEGEQTWAIAYIDAAGNISPAATASAHRDVTTPLISFALNTTITNQRTVFVRDLTVTRELGVPLAGRMGTFQASVLPTFADAPELPFSVFGDPATLTDAIPVALGASDGPQTVRVRFVDNVGNLEGSGSVNSAVVTLDTTPPTAPLFSAVASTIVNTATLSVGALLLQSTDAIGLRATRPYDLVIPAVVGGAAVCPLGTVRIGSVCQWNGTSTVAVPLVAGDNAVRVRGVDTAGNVSDEDIIFIERDSVAPTLSRIAVLDSGGFTASTVVTVEIIASDADSGLKDMQFSTDGVFDTEPFVAFASTTSLVLTGGDGLKTIRVRVRDAAGSFSATLTDTTTLDTTAPVSPPLSLPGNVSTGVNHRCARIDAPPLASIDVNGLAIQARVNGGAFTNCLVTTSTATNFTGCQVNTTTNKVGVQLEQDRDNLVEVRAVDRAGNIGEATSVIVPEVSSTLIPTGLQVKQVCDSGNFLVLKDESIWPTMLSSPPEASGDNVIRQQVPEISLLDLDTLEVKRFNGPDGMAAGMGIASNIGDEQDYSVVHEAACSIESNKVAFIYWRDTGGETTFGRAGLVIWDDPLNNPRGGDNDRGFIGLDPTTGFSASSIDVIDWTDPLNSANDDFDAVVVDTAFAIFAVPDAVRRMSVDGGVVSVTSSFASANTTTPRRFYGLAVSTTTGIAWMDFSSGWRIRQNISGTTTTQFTYNALTFPVTTAMFGIRASPAVFGHRNTLAESANWVYSTGGSVRVGFATVTSTTTVGTGAPDGQPFAERNVNDFTWMDNVQQNRVWENDTFGSTPQSFRFPINSNRPVYATGRTTAGAPSIVFHTGGTGFITGVAVGYRDNTGCFND